MRAHTTCAYAPPLGQLPLYASGLKAKQKAKEGRLVSPRGGRELFFPRYRRSSPAKAMSAPGPSARAGRGRARRMPYEGRRSRRVGNVRTLSTCSYEFRLTYPCRPGSAVCRTACCRPCKIRSRTPLSSDRSGPPTARGCRRPAAAARPDRSARRAPSPRPSRPGRLNPSVRSGPCGRSNPSAGPGSRRWWSLRGQSSPSARARSPAAGGYRRWGRNCRRMAPSRRAARTESSDG